MTDSTEQRLAVERALMDRAHANATRQVEKPPRRLLQHVIALALALSIVAAVLLGFDRFLTSMQKFMELEVQPTAPAATDPVPAYVVPAEPRSAGPASAGGGAPQPRDDVAAAGRD